jgi:hypothetical protein
MAAGEAMTEPGAGAVRYLQVQTTTDSRAEAIELGRDAVRAGGEHVLVGR